VAGEGRGRRTVHFIASQTYSVVAR
jgi:hypothetical protein